MLIAQMPVISSDSEAIQWFEVRSGLLRYRSIIEYYLRVAEEYDIRLSEDAYYGGANGVYYGNKILTLLENPAVAKLFEMTSKTDSKDQYAQFCLKANKAVLGGEMGYMYKKIKGQEEQFKADPSAFLNYLTSLPKGTFSNFHSGGRDVLDFANRILNPNPLDSPYPKRERNYNIESLQSFLKYTADNARYFLKENTSHSAESRLYENKTLYNELTLSLLSVHTILHRASELGITSDSISSFEELVRELTIIRNEVSIQLNPPVVSVLGEGKEETKEKKKEGPDVVFTPPSSPNFFSPSEGSSSSSTTLGTKIKP